MSLNLSRKTVFVWAAVSIAGALFALNLGGRGCAAGVGQKVFGKKDSAQADEAEFNRMLSEAGDFKARERYPEAVAAFEAVIARWPARPEPYFHLGALYFKLNLPSRSEEYYLKAVELRFQNPEIYFHVGYIKESALKFQDALEWYLQAEERGVDSAELFYNTGNVFARLGNQERAIEYYRKAVAVNPSHQDAFVNLSILSFQSGQIADAEFYLDKARKLGYNPPAEYLQSLHQASR
jgi:tetratricopeptide (TPR) repeat protein